MVAVLAAAALIFIPRRMSGDRIEVIVEKGSSSWEVAKQLKDAGIARSRFIFVAYAFIRGKIGDLQAGRYLISPTANISEILHIVSEGLVTPQDTVITIPEGSNISQIAKILENSGLIKKEDFITPEVLALEGYLFPDTYRIGTPSAAEIAEKGDKKIREEIVDEILFKMKEHFNEQIAENLKLDDSEKIKEAIIIASILEKEVRNETDMKLVAGIIKKRMVLGMSLELDATVAYGVCMRQFIQGVFCDTSKVNLVDNIHVDSVYNTYMREGLPAGPISNPGLQAIRAAFNPQPSEYLYYLNARDGTTIFSKTGLEHENNRKKYLGIGMN